MAERYNVETDLREAKAMADALDAYVRGDALYGQAGGGWFSTMPALTVGALLMRLRRLALLRDRLDDAGRAALDAAAARHDAVRAEWRRHYDAKVAREAHSRLDAMRHFFEECSDNPRQCASIYPPEALRRTIVAELAPALDNTTADLGDLNEKRKRLDSRLRRTVQPAPFLWDRTLEPVYPQADYWWLYTRPPQPAR